jgi:hypothetical protein
MSVQDVVRSPTLSTPATPDAREERQLEGERQMVRGAIKGLIIAVPISIAVLVGMMALAMGDAQPWYVWLSLGAGMGVYAAGFLGTVGAVLVAGEKLDKLNAER